MNVDLVTQAKTQIRQLQLTLALLEKDPGYDEFPLDLEIIGEELDELHTALENTDEDYVTED